MKSWILRIGIASSLLVAVLVVSWWAWHDFFSAEQFRRAVAEGNEDRVKWLLRFRAETEPWQQEDARKQLRDAIGNRDSKRAVWLIRLGAPVETNIPDEPAATLEEVLRFAEKPLHWAVKMGDKELAEALLEHGADVNAKDGYGWSPLEDAVADIDMAKLLLAHGAEANAKDLNGCTPLHMTIRESITPDNSKITAMALGKDHEHYLPTLLDPFWRDGRVMAELLLDNGADLNARDIDGATPLHWAATVQQKEAAELFLIRGADPCLKDKEGKTPQDRWPELGEIIKNVKMNAAPRVTKSKPGDPGEQ